MIDTTSSAASLLLEAAARREVPVAHVTGLATRRAADLYAAAAKTDPKGRLRARRLRPQKRLPPVLDRSQRRADGAPANPQRQSADLAADATRCANRLRDALLAASPTLERAVATR